jgi:membrane protein YdbS with pleckstrin-like domain
VTYVYVNGVRRGPFSREQVQSFLRDGLLQPTDLASDGAEGELKSLASFEPPPPASAPTQPDPPPPPVIVPPKPLEQIVQQSLGSFARSTLTPNERPVYRTSLHWIIFVRFAVVALLAFLFVAMPFAIGLQALTGWQIGWFALPLPAFIMVAPTLAYISSELVITDMRVLIKTGIIQRQTLEMFISKIESIAIDQGFLGRILDYGSVTIRGTGGLEEPFETIARPIEFRNWVQRVQGKSDRAAER